MLAVINVVPGLVIATATVAAPQAEPAPDLDIKLIDAPAQRLAVRDVTGSYDGHAQVISGLYMQLGMAGIQPQGNLVGMYPDDPAVVPEASLRWSVGLPVAPDAAPPKPLRILDLPRMQAMTYHTTLGDLDAAGVTAAEWLEESDLVATGIVRMEYLNQAADPAQMRIRVIRPVRAAGTFTLADVAFLAGDWHGTAGDSRIHERWSKPVGDSMLGAFEWVKPDGVWLYELMSVQQRGDEVRFQLRHFDRDFKPWEEPEAHLRMKLVEAGAGKAVFENLNNADDLHQLVFERTDNQLKITLVGREGGEQSFTFKRDGEA